MLHYMELSPEQFEKTATGKKTIELRLYDEKCKLIKPGDEIIFTHTQSPYRSTSVIVDSVITAASFESLSKHISLADCGYETNGITETNQIDMNQYYSKENQRQLGVVGIKFSKNKRSLSNIEVPYEEVKSHLIKYVTAKSEIPEVSAWYTWFEKINTEVLFTHAYKKTIEVGTLEAVVDFFDAVITSYIFDQSIELQDKFVEECGYDGIEDIRIFMRHYYDRPMELEEFFPLKTWWDSTRLSIVLHFTGVNVEYSGCQYSTVFDGIDEDGDWYKVL